MSPVTYSKLTRQICKLLQLKTGFIGAINDKIDGRIVNETEQARTIRQCEYGQLDACIVSIGAGKNGCNLQGMTWMVAMQPISRAGEEEQIMGNDPPVEHLA
jgi:hypothetical protein